MTDFLLELRSEEIPARMQDKARADLERLFVAELAKDGLTAAAIVTYATPRRLALIARDLPVATAVLSEEVKGPRASAPPQALEGFLRKTGLSREQLVDRDGVLFAVIDKPGRATVDVLATAIPAIVRAFPWPKSMRWGESSASTESLRWVRPLQGIVAILGDALVPCEIAGVDAGYATVGHRFHSPHAITMGGAQDYVEKLRACHVVVDQDERRAIIRDRAAALAAEAGLTLIEDEGLVAENAGLTEWPVPLLGRFDPAFLDVPPEVIQLTARVNQKYFVCQGEGGALANAFICVANIAAKDGGERIVAGNQKVLAARLADARFFYETDLKVPLEAQAAKLEKIVFHEKLGTVGHKATRVAKLARWLIEEGILQQKPLPLGGGVGGGAESHRDPTPEDRPHPNPVSGRSGPRPDLNRAGHGLPDTPEGEGLEKELAALAERAAQLCKADLVTGMVGEFPELQGIIGSYYARAQGEDPRIADAIRDHYKPVGQGDEVPTAPVTVAVSLADKLDTLCCFYIIGEAPTGSKDPFALRRAAIGAIRLIVENGLRFRLGGLLADRMLGIATPQNVSHAPAVNDLKAFIVERLAVQQRDAGVRHDLITAVNSLNGGREDDLVRLLARVRALQAFVQTPEGTNLLAGYKRAANILKKEGWDVGRRAASSPAQDHATPPAELDPAGTRAALAAAAANSEPFGDEAVRLPSELAARAVDRADPDGIPQTGEEDPLVEVDTDRSFASSVGAYARSEREKTLSYLPEPAETALMTALDSAEPRAAAAIAAEDFGAAMAALASLRAPIDTFFDDVTVNDPDPARRAARLALLDRMRAAVHTVADFSRIEG